MQIVAKKVEKMSVGFFKCMDLLVYVWSRGLLITVSSSLSQSLSSVTGASVLKHPLASPYTRRDDFRQDDTLKKQNKLKIRAIDLDLELSGEPAYVEQAYEALRPVLMERFRASVDARPTSSENQSSGPSDQEGADEWPLAGSVTAEHVNVVMTSEVYNKVYLVEVEELGDAPITNAIDLANVSRIYINRSQKEQFDHFFKVGKVLWRELTSAGKAAVKGSK